MFSIKHPTSTGRPSKSLMFCRSEGEAAPPSAARCSFLCYTAAVRYRGLQTQQATDREGLGQRKPKESPKKSWKVGRNLQKFHENSNSAVLSFWISESKWPLDGTIYQMDPSGMKHPAIAIPPSSYQNGPGSFFGTNHPRSNSIFVRMSWPSEGTQKNNRNAVNTKPWFWAGVHHLGQGLLWSFWIDHRDTFDIQPKQNRKVKSN